MKVDSNVWSVIKYSCWLWKLICCSSSLFVFIRFSVNKSVFVESTLKGCKKISNVRNKEHSELSMSLMWGCTKILTVINTDLYLQDFTFFTHMAVIFNTTGLKTYKSLFTNVPSTPPSAVSVSVRGGNKELRAFWHGRGETLYCTMMRQQKQLTE